MKTYYGTYTDINESDIYCIYDNYKFYFNSNYIRNKFVKEVEKYIYLEEIKIKSKYKVEINLKNYLAVSYYKKIQKKGFRIENKETNKKIKNFDFKV